MKPNASLWRYVLYKGGVDHAVCDISNRTVGGRSGGGCGICSRCGVGRGIRFWAILSAADPK